MKDKIKQESSYLKIIMLLVLIVNIQACGPKSLLVQDKSQSVDKKKLGFRGNESLSVSYLAKELVSKEKQQITINYFSKSEKVKVWSSSDYTMSGKMIGDVVAGGYGSATGDVLGGALFIASLLGPDGSQDWIDRVFVPAEIDGRKIDSVEDAEKWVNETLRTKVESTARSNGWGYKCLKNCGENNAVYELSINSYPKKSLYKPEKIYVLSYIRAALQPAKKDLLRDAAIGFPVAWEDGRDAYFLIRLISEPEVDIDGNIVLKTVVNERSHLDGADWVTKGKNAELSMVGHKILNAIYDSRHFLKGYKKSTLERVFYNGKIYEWTPYKAHDGFVREEILITNFE